MSSYNLFYLFFRPSTSSLLKHNFFKKASDSPHLATNLLNKVDDIGEVSMSGVGEALPGSGPLYAKGTKPPPGSGDGETNYVPGTTWVFDDEDGDGGSSGKKEEMSIDDFASEFDKMTGGEEFRLGS
jgi:serine/threonine-protein kinase OSR1/STK39